MVHASTHERISNAVAPGTATFTFTGGTGTEVCVMGGPADSGTATADVSLDGVAAAADGRGRLRSGARPHRSATCTDNATTHTLVVTVTSASTFWIDGFYVVP